MTNRTIWTSILIYLLLFATLSCSSKQSITEQDVQTFYTNVEQALNARDADRVLALLSDDAKLNMQATTPDGEQTLSMNKKDYATNLQQSFMTMQNYSYRIDNLKINIVADGNAAEVTVTITETMTIEGETLQASTIEQTRLELRDGKVLAVNVDSAVTVH